MTKQQVCGVMAAVLVATGVSYAQGPSRMSAALSGENEVPAVSTPASGSLVLEIDEEGQAVDYELSYTDLQADPVMAHIHFAQPNVNGGIMVWLCKTTQAQPVPDCPGRSGTVRGTIEPADVLAVGANPVGSQGISAGEFQEFVDALRKGLAYANVHTTLSPGGEIRGQVKPGTGPR